MKLIVSPHADDEVIGCGGLIAKAPWDTAVAVLSDKGDGRMDEFYAARAILQYDHVYLAEFQTGTLAANMRMLVTWLDAVIGALRPTELYLPTPGAHQDHIAAYEAGIRSARLSYTNADSWYVPNVLLYDIPSYATDLYTIPYQWNRFESLTEEQMQTKMAAIRAYKSQNSGSFDPAVLALENANYLGSARGVKYVERYAVVREVRS
jgi:LmbE family N-acetylglucosaminyl deacetylase